MQICGRVYCKVNLLMGFVWFWCLYQIHRDEETGKILNLVFVWADDGEKLKVDVPVVFKGLDHCPGLKKGNTY